MLLSLKLGLAAAALALAFAGGWAANGWRLGANIADMKAAAEKQNTEHRAKETEWGKGILKLMEEGYEQAEKLREATARARTVEQRLHDAGSRHAAAAASAPGTSEAAAAAIHLHSELRRRAIETLRAVGEHADAARAAGLICERADEVTR